VPNLSQPACEGGGGRRKLKRRFDFRCTRGGKVRHHAEALAFHDFRNFDPIARRIAPVFARTFRP